MFFYSRRKSILWEVFYRWGLLILLAFWTTVFLNPVFACPPSTIVYANAEVSVPADAVVKQGETFTHRWSVRNSSTCDAVDYRLGFYSATLNGAGYSGSTFGGSNHPKVSISAGGQAPMEVSFVVPQEVGSYRVDVDVLDGAGTVLNPLALGRLYTTFEVVAADPTTPPVIPPVDPNPVTPPPTTGDPVVPPPPTQGGIDCLPAECEILVTFLSSLGLSGNPCTWEGIYCSGDGHVGGISLGDKANLTGDISVLAGLTELEYIDLWNTQVTGNLSSLAGLTNLISINLSGGTQVTGNLSSLESLTNLKFIHLSDTQVTGNLSSLAGLTNLTWILLDFTQVTGNLSSLAGLTNLTAIHLLDTQVTGNLSSLAGLTNLTLIYLWHTQVTGNLSSLAGLTNLTSIDLQGTQVTGNLSSLEGLTNLESIYLRDTQVTGDLSSLAGLTNLSHISLLNTQVTGKLSNLSNLTNLKHISLGKDGQATDNSLDLITGDLSDLAGLTNLEGIILGNLQITGNLSSLKGLTQLQSINIFDSQIEGDLSGLAGLTNLNHLMLGGNQLTGEITLSLTTLPLEYLSLDGNCLTASDPTVIAFLDAKDPTWKTTQKCAAVPQPTFKITDVYPKEGIYNRNERVLTVWWETTDTSYSTNVKIYLFNDGKNGRVLKVLAENTPNDEQETFIISNDVESGDYMVCINTVPAGTTNTGKCSFGLITIQ